MLFPYTKPEPGCLGKHGVLKALELTRVHMSRSEKDDFSSIPLVHCVPPLDSGQAS